MQRLFCIFVKKKIFANYSIESIFSICSNCIDIIYKTSTKLCYKYLNERVNLWYKCNQLIDVNMHGALLMQVCFEFH